MKLWLDDKLADPGSCGDLQSRDCIVNRMVYIQERCLIKRDPSSVIWDRFLVVLHDSNFWGKFQSQLLSLT